MSNTSFLFRFWYTLARSYSCYYNYQVLYFNKTSRVVIFLREFFHPSSIVRQYTITRFQVNRMGFKFLCLSLLFLTIIHSRRRRCTPTLTSERFYLYFVFPNKHAMWRTCGSETLVCVVFVVIRVNSSVGRIYNYYSSQLKTFVISVIRFRFIL